MTTHYKQLAGNMALRRILAARWGNELTKAGANVAINPLWGEYRHGAEITAYGPGGSFALAVPLRPRSGGWFLHWHAPRGFPPAFVASLFPIRAVHLSPRLMNKFYVDHDEALTAAVTGVKILMTHLTDLTSAPIKGQEERKNG